ncbi:MAG: DEAD/DEAH box helicase [Desulfurococcales archaeon]|nr:DEAD/DEAH box helicase [Desulfurococcales archaeon]
MYSRTRSLRFRVRSWLDKEDFHRLLEFSRYLGRIEGYSVFELDFTKIKALGFTEDDIIAVLNDIPGIVIDDVKVIEQYLKDRKKVIVYYGEDGWIRIRSKVYLKDILSELKVYFPYDREKKEYKAPGHFYPSIVRKLQEKNLHIVDKIGLLDDGSLPRSISFKGTLRPYQEKALEAWRKSGYRGIIALPTGAGKTVIAIAGLAELQKRALIVVYTKEHVKQWIDSIKKFSDAGALVGAYYGDEKKLAPITVTTYQTAYRKLRLFATLFPLVIFDEAHHLPAEKFKAISVGLPAPYRLGLSATVEREDGKHVELFPLLGGIVYRTTPGELTRLGYLAPYVVRRVKVDLLPGEKKEYEMYKRQFRLLSRGLSFNELLARAKKGDPEAIQAIRIHAKMRDIVQYSEAKLRKAEEIIRQELKKGSKIIVFTQYKKQAEEIARRVNGLLLHGGLDKRKRARILETFKQLDSGVMVVTTVGDEGLDIPDANVGVFVSGTGSPRQFIQRLGRLLRPKDGKQAVLYEIIVAGTSEEYQSRKRRRLGGL